METVIVVLALAAGAGGSLLLLCCLAAKRAQLVQAFNIRQKIEEREKMIKKSAGKSKSSPARPQATMVDTPAEVASSP